MRLVAATVVACFAVILPRAAAGGATGPEPSATTSNAIYGIDDNNVIWEMDPVRKSFVEVNDTELPGTNNSNAMAYDTTRDQFLFMHRSTEPGAGRVLLFWDRSTTGPDSLVQVAETADLGLDGVTQEPANAAYYDDAYWFLLVGSSALHKVALSYVDGEPAGSTLTTYDLATYAGPTFTPGGYGDIAISDEGVLYGSHTQGGRFFSIDLELLDDPANTVYSEIAEPVPSAPGYQLSFNADFTVLYAHLHPGGTWYTIDTGSGAVTDLDWATPVGGPNGLRDIGGASASNAATTCEVAEGTPGHQTAIVGATVPAPLTVRIEDTNGNPVDETTVEFTITSGGGSFAGAPSVSVTTDGQGLATTPPWTLGPIPGENSVTASVGNLCTITFTATATAIPPTTTTPPVDGGNPPSYAG